MKKKILFSILGVVAISVLTFGMTYAYYESLATHDITGDAEGGIDTVLTLEKTYHASKLVPLDDSLITSAISKTTNKCIDLSGYEICSLYKITLENTVDSEDLYGYIRTDTSTYTTDNLKYQIFDSNYSALTDIMTLSRNSNEMVYFEKNETIYPVSIEGNKTYYLAIWLTETDEEQSVDYAKDFSGFIGFKSVEYFATETGQIEAGFEG